MKTTQRAATAPCCPGGSFKPCLLCGRPGVIESLYFPGPNSPVAPPPGKGRIIRYRLCEACGRQRQSLLEIIEARIESDLRSSALI